MDKFYSEITLLSSWKEIIDFYYRDDNNWEDWIFRGQSDSHWELSTSLERVLKNYNIPLKEANKKEKGLLRRFKRQYRLFSLEKPDDNDYIEWFSIMQHHGCPTRLLDFTLSFFIALFFAIEGVTFDSDGNKSIAVWAINNEWLKKIFKHWVPYPMRELYNKDGNFKKHDTICHFLNYPINCIKSMNPMNLNQRLVLQQGVFLVPGNLSESLMDNISSYNRKNEFKNNMLKIIIHYDADLLKESFYHLNRMNINNATLFPDIDGFSKYLKMLIPLNEGFLAVDDELF
jgi:hypothetical protein